ncbi:MAG: hypothetical protein J5525_09690 [Lachnospiraceae bacterium]|nr:hypothetical protein [Lachnospiraceae bacterium]
MAEKKVAAKTAAKKAPAKKAPAKKPAAKAVLNSAVAYQFADKEYDQDSLVKIAKDVWKFDLNKKVSDLVNIKLYVKPEESKVYYLFNEEIEGSFDI